MNRALHADRVDHRVGAATVGRVADDVGEIAAVLVQVQGFDAPGLGASQAFRDVVDRDDPGALVVGDARRHVSDRSEAEHRHRPASGGIAAYSTDCHAVGSTSDR